MFCPHCGAQNHDYANKCASCGVELPPQQQAPQYQQYQMPAAPAKTSPLAIWSLVLGIVGCVTCVLAVLTGIPGIILGVLGLKQTKNSPTEYSGGGLAVAGIVVSAISLALTVLVLPAILFPVFARARLAARSAVCAANVRQLTEAMSMYSNDYDNKFPPAASWSDSIKTYVKQRDAFNDPEKPANTFGYGFNSALGGLSQGDVADPSSTVEIFESDRGWNANGGPETMIVTPRHQKGFTIGYTSGGVTVIDRASVQNLNWKPKP